ncbi:MAG: PaaI family thioesterase [candidate division WOR-3 bacterium]
MFKTDGERVYYEFVPQEHHVGYKSRIHGGVITAAMDEAMGWAIYVATRGRMFYTWELRVRFIKPVRPGQRLMVEAEPVGETRACYLSRARLIDDAGVVYARSEGKYVLIPESDAKEVLNYLDDEIDQSPES